MRRPTRPTAPGSVRPVGSPWAPRPPRSARSSRSCSSTWLVRRSSPRASTPSATARSSPPITGRWGGAGVAPRPGREPRRRRGRRRLGILQAHDDDALRRCVRAGSRSWTASGASVRRSSCRRCPPRPCDQHRAGRDRLRGVRAGVAVRCHREPGGARSKRPSRAACSSPRRAGSSRTSTSSTGSRSHRGEGVRRRDGVHALRLAPRTSRRTIPLVNRRRELRLLTDTFEGVRETARGHLVTLLGEPGIGKSCVAEEFLDRLPEPTTVLVGRASPFGEDVTFAPLVQTILGAIGEEAGASTSGCASASTRWWRSAAWPRSRRRYVGCDRARVGRAEPRRGPVP